MADAPAIRLAPMLPADAVGTLCVAFSGGLDSSVLLHLLCATPEIRARGVSVLHVHHGLHPDADAWSAHCQRVCDALTVPLQIARVQVARDRGDGPEAAARRARHDAYAEILDKDDILALAHHRDDQAETFLLRALRASGVDGLGAMRPWQAFEAGWLWRPLLATPRVQLLAYARAHGLHWIEDPSNDNIDLDRNFVRRRVLPLLRERWPQAEASFARSAALSAEAAELLEAEDATALAAALGPDPHTLSVTALTLLPAPRRARVLRRWIDALGLPPLPATGIACIERDMLAGRADSAEAEFAWSDAVVRRWRDLLHAGHRCAPLPTDFRMEWNGAGTFTLPTSDSLMLVDSAAGPTATIQHPEVATAIAPTGAATTIAGGPFTVHARCGGERIELPGRTHSHALKHVLQDLGVPPWLRERLPLLSDAEGTLLAAGDLVSSGSFDAWLRRKGARLVWIKADDTL